jgi:hypothetical protein
MKHRRRIGPKIKWSSRKKNPVILIQRRQRGGFITALATVGSRALRAAASNIAEAAARHVPAIIQGAARGLGPGAGNATITAGTGLARGIAATAPRTLTGIAAALAVSAAAAAMGAIAVYGPSFISSLFTSGSAPAARGGVAKVAVETAKAAGDELGAAVTDAVAAEAAKPPVVLTGPLSAAFIREMKSVDINAYFKANPELKIPQGIDRKLFGNVRSLDKVKAQGPAFFKTMIFNGLVQGTPAEILAEASEILGEAEATALLAPVVNPAIAAERAAIAEEIAAIEEIPEGPLRVERIAERASKILAEVAEEEAAALAESGESAGESRLGTMMNYYRQIYQGLFGFHPEQLVDELILTPQEITGLFGQGRITTAGLASYNLWLPAARNLFETRLGTEQLGAVRQVMTPQIMSQFRSGLLRVFNHNPEEARNIFTEYALHVVPYLATLPNNREQILTRLLSTMNNNPGNVRIVMDELLETITRQAIGLASSAARTINNIPARLLFYTIRGAAAATGLFVVTFLGTPNGGGFPTGGGTAEVIRDRVNEWFGIQLWQTPAPDNTWAGQLAAAAGFQGPDAVQQWGTWIAGQARGWLWNFMGAILAGIGLTAGAAATRLVTYFRGTPDGPPITPANPLTPPAEGTPLTREELAALDVSSSSSSSTVSSNKNDPNMGSRWGRGGSTSNTRRNR